MVHSIFNSRSVWLGVGLAAGLILGAMIPQSPLHAVATDRTSSYAMATGYVDQDFEAVYFLDFHTGDLRAVVLGRQGAGFTAFYAHNVLNDLGVNPAQNPSFMMCTGLANVRRGGGRMQVSTAAVYVAEVTSGRVAAYTLPWSSSSHAAGQMIKLPFTPQGVTQFRAPAAGGAGGVPGGAIGP